MAGKGTQDEDGCCYFQFWFDQDRGPAWKPGKVDVVYFLDIVI